jgi:hypothetical protein
LTILIAERAALGPIAAAPWVLSRMLYRKGSINFVAGVLNCYVLRYDPLAIAASAWRSTV